MQVYNGWLQFGCGAPAGSDISVVYVTTSVISLSAAQQGSFRRTTQCPEGYLYQVHIVPPRTVLKNNIYMKSHVWDWGNIVL